ncbi:MAG: 3-isopropylmalate dehydratase small subunit [Thaumarchaeota archaeon]|nr:3-isopropylmalate dehydratase small subunit [Candidatus Calditenuaceae archaeon]MDW8187303.1 3-isopropylmalate dehydratase small subunit [Nitrososphaerota archaeon]
MPEPISVVVGKAAPLDADDVDTDQIIPAEFLKVLQRKGLGRYLFYRWRYEGGQLTGRFVLDSPEFRDAKVLIAGRNFGIGSSRENAVWALTDFGIRCVIATSFGDIFYGNASKNGLVCVRLPEKDVLELRERARSGGLMLRVDVEKGLVETPYGATYNFEMEPHVRERLLKGLDDIQLTLERYGDAIRRYEERVPKFVIPKRDRVYPY